MLKILVQDDDTGHSSNDDIDIFYFNFEMSPYSGQSSALWSQTVLQGQRSATEPTR